MKALHTMTAFVLTAGIACSLPAFAQVGAGGNSGGGTGGATTQGSPSSPLGGTGGLPGGAPGVQNLVPRLGQQAGGGHFAESDSAVAEEVAAGEGGSGEHGRGIADGNRVLWAVDLL